jgi:hypothetical protein
MATLPIIPTFLPISLDDLTDVGKMPAFNFMRGDIVPAMLDSSNNIINHPTPFYIFCTTKIVNTGNTFETLPQYNPNLITPEAFIQFGITQGSGTVFPGTNPTRNNFAYKDQFTLTNFSKAFTSGVFGADNPGESPGLLVPVYCMQSSATYNPNSIPQQGFPAFNFFRADVFWNGSGDARDQIPDKPINYQSENFPTSLGRNVTQFYFLSALYGPTGIDKNRSGSWSSFLTLFQLNQFKIRSFSGYPTAALVSIAFNDPFDSFNLPSDTDRGANFFPVSVLRSSSIYTVYKMNQDNSGEIGGGEDKNKTIANWVSAGYPGNSLVPATRSYGLPLNFIYQISADTYSQTQGYNAFYQDGDIVTGKNYVGTLCQGGYIPKGYPNPIDYGVWSNNYVSQFFKYNFTFSEKVLTQNGYSSTDYLCSCVQPGDEELLYNWECIGYIKKNDIPIQSSNYYGNTCSNVHTGIFQFSAFQFVPVNFFSVPRKGAIPPIFSPEFPISGGYKGEVAIPGTIGPAPIYGPPAPIGATGTVPGPPMGPVGAGPYSISFPYSSATGANNNWNSPGELSNRIPNTDLGEYIAGWYENPLNYECPRDVSVQGYCGFQDYYHSLLGYFYERPQNIPYSGECGDYYIPPFLGMVTSSINYPFGGCLGANICVPNYKYLENIGSTIEKPFVCQDPFQSNPYPQSTNGFNNTNSYQFQNYNYTLLIPPQTIPPTPNPPIPPTFPGFISGWTPFPTNPKPPAFPPYGKAPFPANQANIFNYYTPITWENLNTYRNLTPNQVVPSNIPSFTPAPFLDSNTIAQQNLLDPLTGKTREKGDTPIYIVLAIIAVIIFVFAIVFFVYYSRKNKDKDMRNPSNFMYYTRVQ